MTNVTRTFVLIVTLKHRPLVFMAHRARALPDIRGRTTTASATSSVVNTEPEQKEHMTSIRYYVIRLLYCT